MNTNEVRKYLVRQLNPVASAEIAEALAKLPEAQQERLNRGALDLLLRIHSRVGGRSGTEAVLELIQFTQELLIQEEQIEKGNWE